MVIECKNITDLIFILDKSGSMSGLEKDTIGGFNSLIEKQKKEEGLAYVTTVLFSDKTEIIHDRMEIKDVTKLTEKEYYVGGCTALLDAIGETINNINEKNNKLDICNKANKTLFVITTDGMENASREYDYKKIKKMIEEKKECGWDFLFLGANIDAIETASRFGIDEDNAVEYKCDSKGVNLNYESLNEAVMCVRKTGKVNKKWKECIEKDYEERK